MKEFEFTPPEIPEPNQELLMEELVHYDDMPDGVTVKSLSPSGADEYKKCMIFSGHRYRVSFVRVGVDDDAEFKIRFGLAMTERAPVTNSGLDVFRKLTHEMHAVYEDIVNVESVKALRFYASNDGPLEEVKTTVADTLRSSPEKLNGFLFNDEMSRFVVRTQDGTVSIDINNPYGVVSKTFPVDEHMLDAIAAAVEKIDSIRLVYDLFEYIQESDEEVNVTRKEQRLKLYLFYMRKQFPEFDYNVETVMEGNRKVIKFEKDENGEPYVRAVIHKETTPHAQG